MMRKLILMRHAEASNVSTGGGDSRRPLTERGRQQAIDVGLFLATKKVSPDYSLASNSMRTKETVYGVVEGLATNPHLEFDPFLYNCRIETLIEQIKDIPPHVNTLLVVNHNPSIHELVLSLCAHNIHLSNDTERDKIASSFPPAALCIFDCDVPDWQSFEPKVTRLSYVHLTP